MSLTQESNYPIVCLSCDVVRQRITHSQIAFNAFDRVSALLKPGGVLYLRDLVFSCEPREAARVIDAWLASAPAQTDVGWTRTELETHLREEHSTFSWLLEPMIERAGLAIQQAQHSHSRVYAAYTCIKR
jgi:hypothetical protein